MSLHVGEPRRSMIIASPPSASRFRIPRCRRVRGDRETVRLLVPRSNNRRRRFIPRSEGTAADSFPELLIVGSDGSVHTVTDVKPDNI
jgi:hypothetical protein